MTQFYFHDFVHDILGEDRFIQGALPFRLEIQFHHVHDVGLLVHSGKQFAKWKISIFNR